MATEIIAEAEAIEADHLPQESIPACPLYILFFASGVPAIIYQIVWQRALFAVYGINVESVTIVVSAFMLGLGLGSLAGGVLSRSRRLSLLALFAAAELGTAIFGLVSLNVFHYVAEYTLASPLWMAGIMSFLLVVVPTTLMGSTLPLLVEHLVRTSRNVGSSVGALYFVNTLGSGVACIIAVWPLMSHFGQTGSLRCAALINAIVGVSVLAYDFQYRKKQPEPREKAEDGRTALDKPILPFALGLLCAAFGGFSALAYEIIWYRLLVFTAADTAPLFAWLLGSYLVGLAFGSRLAERYAERRSVERTLPVLTFTLLGSATVSFWIGPATAMGLKAISPQSSTIAGLLFMLLICLAAILFGALFPLIAHVAVGSRRAGTAVSYLYAANIAGSTLGVLLVGFVLMDRFSLYRIVLALLVGGVLCSAVVCQVATGRPRGWKPAFALACIASILMAPFTRGVFATIYDRLLFKKLYPTAHFEQVIENRSGTIGITPNGTVFGGGVYDGQFSTDLLHDTNGIVRPYALSVLHASPSHVLMIGLGSGSWAQVIANHPQVQDLTVVEINRGYLEAIRRHPATASLLHNPKVTIIADDGRRWLLHHPQARFDAVVMNTTLYWRNHSSNLLSVDFLEIVRTHLRPGGILFYNTTGSDDVVATGLAVYPYAVRLFNMLAVSDSPLTLDRSRWKSVLLRYVIDGEPVLNADDPEQRKKLAEIVDINNGPPGREHVEENGQLRKHLRGGLIITDDNMGVEWQLSRRVTPRP